MQRIELGYVLTPIVAADRGLQLEREREHHSIRIILYREGTRTGPIFYITVNHIVLTITSIERIAMYALLHS